MINPSNLKSSIEQKLDNELNQDFNSQSQISILSEKLQRFYEDISSNIVSQEKKLQKQILSTLNYSKQRYESLQEQLD